MDDIIPLCNFFRLMDYNARMNYEELSGKSVLLLGKTRSLNMQEFETLLTLHGITLCKAYEEGVGLIIEGRMMNPLESAESARLYETENTPISSIEGVEKWLCRSLEPDRLLMSLKLSRDQERLVDFIQNPHIPDDLFFKLLKLYDWKGDGLFDNDENRDVTAAIIGRFYKDLERNHNVQYAMSGLAHLIERYGSARLIEAISELSPIARELKSPSDRSLAGVFDAMAFHTDTPIKLLRSFVGVRSELLARRVPLGMEDELFALRDPKIDFMLAHNESLSEYGADRLEQEYPHVIAANIPLSQERFERLISLYPAALASNATLTPLMQQRLAELNNKAVCSALASNRSTISPLLDGFYSSGRYHRFLAANPSLSAVLLEALSRSDETEVLSALASNSSTPVAILYQLSLDRRYERSVKTNPAFGKHIQTHNIGWQS